MSYSAQTRLVNVPTLWLGALRLQIEAARAFVGVHNEHFLHHRRRGRGNHSCGVLGSASLRSRHLARPLVVAVNGLRSFEFAGGAQKFASAYHAVDLIEKVLHYRDIA